MYAGWFLEWILERTWTQMSERTVTQFCVLVKLRNPIDQPLLLSSLQRSYRSIQTRDIKGDLPAAAKNSWRSGPRCYGEDTRIWRGGGQVALASHNWHILICNTRENPNPHLLLTKAHKSVHNISTWAFALFIAHYSIFGCLNMVSPTEIAQSRI